MSKLPASTLSAATDLPHPQELDQTETYLTFSCSQLLLHFSGWTLVNRCTEGFALRVVLELELESHPPLMQELPSWPKAPQSHSQAFCAAMLPQTCLVTSTKKGAIDSFQKCHSIVRCGCLLESFDWPAVGGQCSYLFNTHRHFCQNWSHCKSCCIMKWAGLGKLRHRSRTHLIFIWRCNTHTYTS